MKHLGNYFDSGKMFTFVRGYAMGKGWNETIHALNYARKLHTGQNRKSGEPYIIHPLTMVSQAISMGINDDYICASLLLHDVVEDCGVSINDLPVCDEVKRIVELLTYQKLSQVFPSEKESKTSYYNLISKDGRASICKIIDRCNNVSSMSGVFSPEKLKSYIEETNEYVLPLIKTTKEQYPEYSNAIFCLKYHIYSVLTSIEGIIEHNQVEKTENQYNTCGKVDKNDEYKF